ncbi:stalk domain-containing protein [Anaerosphaera multitolerans]|uniref:Copper amine oxidase n=1 Tax=Anaerosphaera multitolerans TaxID=2487351 RepID=A0A437S6T3_9FIRM|nr:stalk domain-containing protein [Anaerosphaera multitolerans]RVU54740.1 copper amine oxidase [Anaerosphaera multitolerans]
MKDKIRKILALILITCLLSTPLSVFAEEPQFSEIISQGVTREQYTVNRGGYDTVVNVLKCDLTNQYLNIEVVAGGGKYTNKATVSEMASRTDATALVNGDFFNMLLQGAPEGPSIVSGKLESSPCVYTGLYSLGITQDNTAHIEQIQFSGKVTAKNGKSYPIDGLNKSYYWYDGTNEYSHENKIQLYSDFWASSSRGDKNNSEILVNGNGVVEQISENQNFNFSVPDGKMILQADGLAYDFIKQNIKVGDVIKVDYAITPQRDFKFLIGGHALLVDNGEIVPYTKDVNVLGGSRARTAAGISKDGKTLYLVSAEGRTSRSDGFKLETLADFMKSIGCHRAVNLDGGGSTAMVVKNLGEFERTRVINPERNAAERKVVSGIGIYNTAPSTGVPIGAKIKGPDVLVIGQSAEYSLGGVWDENYKPINTENSVYTFSSDEATDGVWDGKWFLALNSGTVNLHLTTAQGFKTTKPIEVKGFDYIDTLSVKANKQRVSEGETINITAEATLKNKEKVVLSPKVLEYSIEGFDGSFDENGNLLINALNDNLSGKVTVKAGDVTGSTTLTDNNAKIINMNIGKKDYTLNDEKKEMDAAPYISNNRTFVPVRFIVEGFGGKVDYDEENKVVKVTYNNNEILIPVGSSTIEVNGDEVTIDAPAVIKENRTYIPVRFVAEALGMEVDYNSATRGITIIELAKENLQTNNDFDETIIENIEEENLEINLNNVDENSEDVQNIIIEGSKENNTIN